MKRQRWKAGLLTAALAAPAGLRSARAEIGLGARFGDVILENVQPGRTYDLREAAHVPFGVENRGDADSDATVEFEKPTRLAEGYEAVPDPGWFKAIPSSIRIGAHSIGYFDLLLTVPEDPALKGRNFQVNVKARLAGEGMFSLAVDNRVRFSIGPGPESVQAEKKKKAMQQLDFDVTPSEIYLRDVPVGRTYDARKEARKSIRVANFAPDALAVLMTVEKWDRNYPLPEGYEPIPEPGWMRMSKSTVTVAGDQIGQASFTVKIPDDAKWKGKRFAAMVRTGLTSGFWLDAPVKVYLETKP